MTDASSRERDRRFREEELEWVAAHLTDLRRTVSERRIRSQLLWAGFAIGLIVHVVAYLLKSSGTGEPIGVVVDILYAFGYALWTGVVVVALVEVIPAAKERQMSRALDAYEAALSSRSRSSEAAADRPDQESPR
jgi:hypothetical protein